jgi:bacterial/archaeal transporter family-2 protein
VQSLSDLTGLVLTIALRDRGRMPPARRLFDLAAAFGTGGLLTLMVLFNGQMGAATTAYFSSLAAHAMGTLAAAVVLMLLFIRGRPVMRGGAPWWSFTAGCVGAVTVMLTSVTVNSALALSGTLALGLAGQVLFGLAADRFGLFGLPRRDFRGRDGLALGLIVTGSLIIIFLGGAA